MDSYILFDIFSKKTAERKKHTHCNTVRKKRFIVEIAVFFLFFDFQ